MHCFLLLNGTKNGISSERVTKSIFHWYSKCPPHTNRAERPEIFVRHPCYLGQCQPNRCTATVPVIVIFCNGMGCVCSVNKIIVLNEKMLTCSLALICVANSSNQFLNQPKFCPNYFSMMCSTSREVCPYSRDELSMVTTR